MNIILNDSGSNIGGIEVMFIEMTKYLVLEGHTVYFIVNENSVYEKELLTCNNVLFIRRKYTGLIEFTSIKKDKEERNLILSQFNLNEDYYVISPYFQNLQLAMSVFKNRKNFKLLNLWPHPQHWAKQSKLKPSDTFTKDIKKTSKYYYQRDLLMVLEDKNAHFYAARAVPVFNNWFYSISLNPTIIETLPIQSSQEDPKTFIGIGDNKSIKVLWCGRFTYFKNEAIIEVSKVLDLIAKKMPEYNIEYGIIGYGGKSDTSYIKKNIISDNIKVTFLGKISPNKLLEVFKEYDVGVGMGLTVKKMAQVGLPAIVIDSFEKESEHRKNCNWLFDTTEGDAGDGYYYKIANETIENRSELYEILIEVIQKPYLLEEYSKECLYYVKRYYSFDKQVQAILDAAKKSTFHAGDFPVFRRNLVTRFMYNVYKKVNNVKRIFIK